MLRFFIRSGDLISINPFLVLKLRLLLKLITMRRSFDIAINIMGDVDDKIVKVDQEENSDEFEVTMPDGVQHVAVKFSDAGDLVQTYGTPLDSNTLHSMSEGIKKSIK